MYTPDQVEKMIFQHCNERLQMSSSMFYNYKAWTSHSLYSLSGMDSIDVFEFNMFTEQAFGVTMSEDELYHLSLESIIKKCVSLQKPKPMAPKPQVEQAKTTSEQAKSQPVAPTPQAEQAKITSEQAKPQPVTTEPQAEQVKPKTTPKPQAEQAKPQVEQAKPAEQPQVETKTMEGMMLCKLLGDVCNRRPTGKPNYDAQNWCEFVGCVLFKNFQKLR